MMSQTKMESIMKRNAKVAKIANDHLLTLTSVSQLMNAGTLEVRGKWIFVSECHGADCDNKGSADCGHLFCGRCSTRYHRYTELLAVAAQVNDWTDEVYYGHVLPPLPPPTMATFGGGLWPMYDEEEDNVEDNEEDNEAPPAAPPVAPLPEAKVKLSREQKEIIARVRAAEAEPVAEADAFEAAVEDLERQVDGVKINEDVIDMVQ